MKIIKETDSYIVHGNGDKLLVLVPHAGDEIPPELVNRIDPTQFNKKGHDLFAKELYRNLSPIATVIEGKFHRELIDLNRERDDYNDPGGVMPTIGFHGNKFIENYTEKEREELLKKYYDPFHKEVKEIRSKMREKGPLLIIPGHTMEGSGPKHAPDAGIKRPDITLCTKGKTLANISKIELLLENLKKEASNLRIEIDNPYEGKGPLTEGLSDVNNNINLIQIEVNIDTHKTHSDLIRQAIISSVRKLIE